MSIVRHEGIVWLGLDVHKDSITAAVLGERDALPRLEVIGPEDEAVRRFISRVGAGGRELRACYEAGPTGYELHRLLRRINVACTVVAPSLIPRAPGDRVKTDRRDATRLVRLFRAGELTAIRVPTPTEEAVRDLCRARADTVDEVNRTRRRLGAFLLRHHVVWPSGKTKWTQEHRRWLRQVSFEELALRQTLEHYLSVLAELELSLRAVEAELLPWCERDPFAWQVRRLRCYRGVADLGALTFASEVCDWRRFPAAGGLMAFTGLIPSERSSGGSHYRGAITHAGNTHLRTQLVEAAHAYRHPAKVNKDLARRQAGNSQATIDRAWAAQRRLCARYRRLNERKHVTTVVVTAVARELAGFLWAEMTATD